MLKNPKNSKFKATQAVKTAVYKASKLLTWFHEKSEWQKKINVFPKKSQKLFEYDRIF